MLPISTDEPVELGCEVELTAINVAGQAWWTVGFEAFGEEADLTRPLKMVANHLLLPEQGMTLAAEHSHGYPRWLAVLDY